MNTVISKTIKATILGLGMQIPEIPAQRKFVSSVYFYFFFTFKKNQVRKSNAKQVS